MNHRRRLVAVSVNTLVFALLLAGCAGDESGAGSATGGSAATTDSGGATGSGGAATGGVSTGGVATGGVSTGGVATGGVSTGGVATGGVSTGTGGIQSGSGGEASCDNVTPCGGDVVGTWNATSSCLKVTGELDLVPFGVGCTSAPVTGSLQVSGTWTANSDGTYSDNTSTSGEEQFTLTPDCLNVSGTTTTCERISGALGSIGYSAVTCTDAGSGGCDCSATVEQTGGIGVVSMSLSSSGTYTTADNVITTSDETQYSYCVSGNTMTMSLPNTKKGTVTGTVVFQKQ
jgi:hypothetical protein